MLKICIGQMAKQTIETIMFTVSKMLPIQKELVSEVGFEPPPPCGDQKPQQLRSWQCLESGALDRSAILTCWHKDINDNSIIGIGQMAKQIIETILFTVSKNASNYKRTFVRSGIWSHASMWRPETSTTEKEITPWVWRLRPLGHSDISTKWC